MKTHTLLFFLKVFFLTTGIAFADTRIDQEEFLSYELPYEESKKWKEITCIENAKERTYEYIPSDQQVEDWSELISVQFFDKLTLNNKDVDSIDKFLGNLQKELDKAYPGNEVTFRIVEKKGSDAIYEWILHKSYKDTPAQHEIARAFVTEAGLHRIGFTQLREELQTKEREKWITFLRASVSVKANQGAKDDELFLVSDAKSAELFELGSEFINWRIVNNFTFNTGYVSILRVPPWCKEGEYINECLELSYNPVNKSLPFENILEIEKKFIEKKTSSKADLTIVKQSPSEVVYHYVCPFPKDKLLINGICRSIKDQKGWFSIHYKRRLPFKLAEEEKLQWQQRLEKIQVVIDQ